MSDQKIPYIVDSSLTPKNAVSKGYKYIQDVIDPYSAVKKLIELAEKEGYIFGSSTKGNTKVGLYKKEKKL